MLLFSGVICQDKRFACLIPFSEKHAATGDAVGVILIRRKADYICMDKLPRQCVKSFILEKQQFQTLVVFFHFKCHLAWSTPLE